MEVPDHWLHLPDVSPQLQVLAVGFSWALYFCQKMVESCVRIAGFSADALLMDRHRSPLMSRDLICFGVYVDGVCAVGFPFRHEDRTRTGRELDAILAALRPRKRAKRVCPHVQAFRRNQKKEGIS